LLSFCRLGKTAARLEVGDAISVQTSMAASGSSCMRADSSRAFTHPLARLRRRVARPSLCDRATCRTTRRRLARSVALRQSWPCRGAYYRRISQIRTPIQTCLKSCMTQQPNQFPAVSNEFVFLCLPAVPACQHGPVSLPRPAQALASPGAPRPAAAWPV
jgi:hypothetical protein